MLRWLGKHTFEKLLTLKKGAKAEDVIDLTSAKELIDFKDGSASSKNPTTNAEDGWINVKIDGTTKYIPYYAS